jgi:hypothetical protein
MYVAVLGCGISSLLQKVSDESVLELGLVLGKVCAKTTALSVF